MKRSICVLVVAIAGVLLGSSEHPARAGVTAVRGVRLFDGTRVVPRANVVFDGTTIVAAGPGVAIPAGATVIDGTGRTLLPGLIDSHTHAFGPALERALRFGVTTELDMFTSVDALKQWKREQSEGIVTTRADIRSAGTLITVKGGHGTEYIPIPTYAPGTDPQEFVDARIAEGSDYIKLIEETGEAYGAHIPTLSRADLEALITAAHKRKKMAVVHISTLAGAKMAIESGADGLVHLFGDHAPDEGFGKFAAAHHVFVVPTLTVIESASGVASGASLVSDARMAPYLSIEEIANLKRSFPKRAANDDLLNAAAALHELKAARVPLLAGTDAPNPGTTHGASIHRELELLVQNGLTPVEALTAATSTPAKIFALADRGRIAKGLRADLVLVNGDPTTDIQATRDIVTVWRNGVALPRQPETRNPQGDVETIAPEKLKSGVISNFDSGAAKTEFGSAWVISTDQYAGGKSTATMSVVEGGAAGTAGALHVVSEMREGFAYPWAGAMAFFGTRPMSPVNLSQTKGLSFYARGDTDIMVMIFARSLGRIPAQKVVHAGSDWTLISVGWSDFGIDGSDVQAILFSGRRVGTSEFSIDELRFSSDSAPADH
jgi:imidazolonepropionase-like amidohydrolase